MLPFAPPSTATAEGPPTMDAAIAAFKNGRMRDAQTLALQANAATPNADAAELVAVTSLRLGEMARAHQVYRRLAAAPGVPDGPRGRAARQLEALRGQGGLLSLSVTPPDARVTFDDHDLGPASEASPVFSLPGKHRLGFTAAGFAPATRTFVFARGRNEQVSVSLSPVAEALTAASTAAPVPVPFECVPATLTLIVDGLELPCPRDPVSLEIGEHAVAGKATGYVPRELSVHVSPGMSLPVAVVLTSEPAVPKLAAVAAPADGALVAPKDTLPPPASTPPASRPRSPETPVTVALAPAETVAETSTLKTTLRWGGAAVLSAGAIAGIVALVQSSELRDACPDGRCPSSRADDIESLKTTSWLSTLGVALGAAALGTSFAF